MKKAIVLLTACMISSLLYANHYVVTGTQSQRCGIVASILIDEQFPNYGENELELGVFCGEECRASVMAYEFTRVLPNGTTYHFFRADPNVICDFGDILTFKLWNHRYEVELETSTTLVAKEDGYGNMVNPQVLNFTTPGYSLNITGYTEEGGNGDNWYLISTPIGEVNPETIEGMTSPDFDLFYFDQSSNGAEWKNYKANHFNLEPRKGYLYAHNTNVTLNFGTETYTGSGDVTLVKDDNANLAGWNLIGNPFGTTTTIGRAFYVMNPAGTEIVAATTNQIAPMQGIFVIAESDGETVTFTPGTGSSDGEKLVINVVQNRNDVIDRAIVRFGQGGQLPKFMLNPNNTKIYIPQADNEYAVVRSDNEAELPVNFKTAENGTYTFKVDANTSEMDYLHLIDNKTGNDVDLLETPSYTFEANTTDFANRFKLVFRNTTGIDENSEQFAFFNGHDWTVNNKGRATLQVIDMTGRLISTETLDGNAHVTIDAAPGVYMLQLTNGNDVKTQKVIIK